MAGEFLTDQVILVADNPIQPASVGSTVDFYARLINLTLRDVKVSGVASGMTQIKHGQYLKVINSLPSDVPRLSVSEPIHVLRVELNPEHFHRMESVHVALVQLVILGSSGLNISVEPTLWQVNLMGLQH
jgi:hypothetical protein